MRATAGSDHPFASCEVMRSHYGPLVQTSGAAAVVSEQCSQCLEHKYTTMRATYGSTHPFAASFASCGLPRVACVIYSASAVPRGTRLRLTLSLSHVFYGMGKRSGDEGWGYLEQSPSTVLRLA